MSLIAVLGISSKVQFPLSYSKQQLLTDESIQLSVIAASAFSVSVFIA